MAERRGVVYIAPDASYLPTGRLVEPETFTFFVHWEDWNDERQTGEMLADGGKVERAEVAIAWGRERCDRVLIRLAHTPESYYSAGHIELTEELDGSGAPLPVWPPDAPPTEGWWTPAHESAAESEAAEHARHQLVDPPHGFAEREGWTGRNGDDPEDTTARAG
jgi:hypothetical protein